MPFIRKTKEEFLLTGFYIILVLMWHLKNATEDIYK